MYSKFENLFQLKKPGQFGVSAHTPNAVLDAGRAEANRDIALNGLQLEEMPSKEPLLRDYGLSFYPAPGHVFYRNFCLYHLRKVLEVPPHDKSKIRTYGNTCTLENMDANLDNCEKVNNFLKKSRILAACVLIK